MALQANLPDGLRTFRDGLEDPAIILVQVQTEPVWTISTNGGEGEKVFSDVPLLERSFRQSFSPFFSFLSFLCALDHLLGGECHDGVIFFGHGLNLLLDRKNYGHTKLYT